MVPCGLFDTIHGHSWSDHEPTLFLSETVFDHFVKNLNKLDLRTKVFNFLAHFFEKSEKSPEILTFMDRDYARMK